MMVVYQRVGLIDRLTHHAAIVEITGDCYRLHQAEHAQKARLFGHASASTQRAEPLGLRTSAFARHFS